MQLVYGFMCRLGLLGGKQQATLFLAGSSQVFPMSVVSLACLIPACRGSIRLQLGLYSYDRRFGDDSDVMQAHIHTAVEW